MVLVDANQQQGRRRDTAELIANINSPCAGGQGSFRAKRTSLETGLGGSIFERSAIGRRGPELNGTIPHSPIM